MCGGKGGAPTTTTQQTNQNVSYTPTGLPLLSNIYNQAAQAASTPYQPYTGQLVAPLNATQNAATGLIQNAQNIASPFINQGGGMLQTGANAVQQNSAPITPGQIQGYMNPYQQQVINATMGNINETNAEQLQQVQGNAALQGALGGDRSVVAQSELARQQALASNQTLAGLNAQNYGQATQTALAEQQAGMAGGQSLANMGMGYASLGTAAENQALTGAQSLMGAGTLGQQTQQAQDTAQYQQFLQQLAYPYQQAQFLANIGIPAAGAMGGFQNQIGTTNQVTTPPGLSNLQALLGGLTILPGLLPSGSTPTTGGTNPSGLTTGNTNPLQTKRGGRIDPYAFDSGGMIYPWDVGPDSFIPGVGGAAGGGGGGGAAAGAGKAGAMPLGNMSMPGMSATQQPPGLSASSLTGALGGINAIKSGVSGLSGLLGGDAAPVAVSDAAAGLGDAEIGTGLADAAATTAAEGAGEAAAAGGIGDMLASLLPFLALKRGGAAGYDDGGEVPDVSVQSGPYPTSDAYNFQHSPYAVANVRGRVPSSQRMQAPHVNFGYRTFTPLLNQGSQSNPYAQLFNLEQQRRLAQAMQSATGGRIGYDAGGATSPLDVEGVLAQQAAGAMPLQSLDAAQILQRAQANMKPMQQTMQTSFAATGGHIRGYDDGGDVDYSPTDADQLGSEHMLLPSPSGILHGIEGAIGDYAHAAYPTAGSPSPDSGGPLPYQQQPYIPPANAAQGALPAAAEPTRGTAPAISVTQRDIGGSPTGASPTGGGPGGLSWDQIMNPNTFKGNTPQRTSIRDMAKNPDFWLRAGLGILAAPPSQGVAAAVAHGFEGSIGTYDQWSKENLSAEQKAQELAAKIKEHVDEYTKIKPSESARIGIEREKLDWLKQQSTLQPYIDVSGYHLGHKTKQGQLLDENGNPAGPGAQLVTPGYNPYSRAKNIQDLEPGVTGAEAEKRAGAPQLQPGALGGPGGGDAATNALPDPGAGKRVQGKWYIGPSGKPQQWLGNG